MNTLSMKQRLLTLLTLLMALGLFSNPSSAGGYSALVVEPESGRVLYEKNANELRHPASITKIMTLYLVFEALERGEITLNTPFSVSRYAVLRPPSRLGLTPGDSLAVEDAILALVTRSANDAASVIAENLGGSEPAFGDQMTAKAHALGMQDTVFRNASGLPDPAQWTTAWDMYRLAKAMISNFPRYYPYFSTPRFYYRGQSFDNHNHLMESYPGMDGIKTGFINSSGFNLVASAKRNGRRLIGVVFGGPSARARDRHMRDILDDGFSQLNGQPPQNVIADFERAPIPKSAGFDRYGPGSPELTFGSQKRFKRGAVPARGKGLTSSGRELHSAQSVGARKAAKKTATTTASAKPANSKRLAASGTTKTSAPKSSACKGSKCPRK